MIPKLAPMRSAGAALVLALLVTGLAGLAALAPTAAAERGSTVATTSVRGTITPVTADHLGDTIARAHAEGHEALVVELDTPGGLVASMRVIVQDLLAAPLPVIVYVSPPGADAGSAGTYITLAAHVAAMAPTTTIGAATPVDLEGGEVGDKAVNNAAAYAEAVAEARDRDVEFAVDAVRDGRAITVDEAVDIGAVDLQATTVDELLEAIDGREVSVDGQPRTLETADAALVSAEMSGIRQLLQRLAEPNLAFIFLSIGTLAILYELANPGIGAGGIVGVISIVLAMYALSVLPVSYAGVALLVLGVAMIAAEAFTPAFGVAGVGGTASLVLGGLFLFPRASGIAVDLTVLLPAGVVTLVLTLLAGHLVARSHGRPSQAASNYLIGRTVTVEMRRGRPHALIDGTWWRLRTTDATPLADGVTVTVVGRDNLELIASTDPDGLEAISTPGAVTATSEPDAQRETDKETT